MRFNFDVILCTFNGSAYLKQQLDSILLQKYLPSKIIISDDGSTDNTIQIAKDYMAQFEMVEFIIVKGPGKGPSLNFISSLSHTNAEFVFLADQDDIWLKHKVERFKQEIDKNNNANPQLYYSDAILIDNESNLIGKSHLLHLGIFPNKQHRHAILFKNHVQGATTCLNSNLIKLILELVEHHGYSKIAMHDWWFALLANYFGDLIYIDEQLIEYRQHGSNIIGVNKRLKFADIFCSVYRMTLQMSKLIDVVNDSNNHFDFSNFYSVKLLCDVGLIKYCAPFIISPRKIILGFHSKSS